MNPHSESGQSPIQHSAGTGSKLEPSVLSREASGNEKMKLECLPVKGLLPYKTKTVRSNISLNNGKVLRKSRDKKPKQHMKIWAICQIYYLLFPLPPSPQISGDLPNNIKDKRNESSPISRGCFLAQHFLFHHYIYLFCTAHPFRY